MLYLQEMYSFMIIQVLKETEAIDGSTEKLGIFHSKNFQEMHPLVITQVLKEIEVFETSSAVRLRNWGILHSTKEGAKSPCFSNICEEVHL